MTTSKRLVSIAADQITPTTPRFAWAGRVPLGAVTILAGPPGQGKTQLALGMCSRATRGTLDGDLAGPVDALYVSAEDSPDYTLTPRAMAAGASLDKLHFIEGVHTSSYAGDEERPGLLIPDDLPLLEQWLERTPARIIVLDPIVALIPVNLNTHRDQHVRRALAPLAHIADKYAIAVIGVMHLNKNTETDALNRLSGSIGFGGAARSVLLFAADPDDVEGENGSRRILAHVKCNVGPRQPSIAYRIEARTVQTANESVETSVAIRDGAASVSANDLLGNATSSNEASARSEAREFLVAELSTGAVPTAELKQHAEDAGLNWRTVERAKQQLGVRARKRGASWRWELPDSPTTPPVGLDGVVGLEEIKADKDDNTDCSNAVADFDVDAEYDRLIAKHRDML